MEKHKSKIAIYDIAMIGIMVAVIEVCKAALSFLPNIELTSFWMIMFTLFFGWRVLFVVPVFILIEGSIYGFGLWWFMYLYIWPLLALLAFLFRKKDNLWFWTILSAFFGLFFGALCSIAYVIVAAVNNGFVAGITAGFTWWIAGIPWDLVHCAGNGVVMAVLYKPVRSVMNRMKVHGIIT